MHFQILEDCQLLKKQNIIKMELTAPLDFGNYTFRCSSVGKLMTKPRGKSPMQRYEECRVKILDFGI